MEEPRSPSPDTFFRVGFFVELGLVAVAGLIGFLAFDRPVAFRLDLDAADALKALLATAPLAALALIFTTRRLRRLAFLERIHQVLRKILYEPIRAMTGSEILLLSAAAGVGEEALFRGVLQPLIGPWWSSGIFALLHALTPSYFILAGLMSLYLGWLQDMTQNLAVPMIVHGAYDAVALYLLRGEFRREAEGKPANMESGISNSE